MSTTHISVIFVRVAVVAAVVLVTCSIITTTYIEDCAAVAELSTMEALSSAGLTRKAPRAHQSRASVIIIAENRKPRVRKHESATYPLAVISEVGRAPHKVRPATDEAGGLAPGDAGFFTWRRKIVAYLFHARLATGTRARAPRSYARVVAMQYSASYLAIWFTARQCIVQCTIWYTVRHCMVHFALLIWYTVPYGAMYITLRSFWSCGRGARIPPR
jgi:hypothetical protein